MRLGIGLGLFKSGALSVGLRIFSAYKSRVIGDGGTVEAASCVINGINSSAILQTASLLLIPSGYKSGVAYSEIPTNGNGDLTWSRAGTALRTNSSGLLESMGSGVPRLSYMYGSCPALLAEPQRTNVATQSTITSFGSAGGTNVWINGTASPAVINQTTGIDGTQNGTRYTKTSGYTNQDLLYKLSIPVTSGTTYTISGYIKLGTASNAVIVVNNTSAWNTIPGANIVCSTSNGFNTTSWRRFSITIVAPTTNAINIHYGYHQETGVTAQADGTFFLDGLQVEAGSYASTIIPTTTASATRVADSFSRSNIYTNGLISASGGTWFVELRNNVAYVRDSSGALYIGTNSIDANSGNGLLLRNPGGTTRILIRKVIGGTGTDLYQTITDTIKVAIKWNGTSCDVFVNGTKQVSASAFTTTNMEYLNLASIPVPYFIQQMALFPTPLSDAQLTQLTTL